MRSTIRRLIERMGAAGRPPQAEPPEQKDAPAAAAAAPAVAISRDFLSLEEFEAFVRTEPESFQPDLHERILAHCLQHGVTSPALGFSDPSTITVIGTEFREHLMVRNMNSRQRAVIDEVENFRVARGLSGHDIKIYGHEAITAVALHLRGRFAKYIGTEFAANEEQASRLFPILHGDVCHSTFGDSSFDVVISCDVLEHVPDIDLALSETARILSRMAGSSSRCRS